MKKIIILLVALVWVAGAKAQWLPLYLSDTLTTVSIYFTDANTGYVSVYNTDFSPDILKTIDGGANWIEQYTCSGNVVIGSIFFPDASTGYAIIDFAPWPYGSDHRLMKTSDGGANWEIVYDFQYPVSAIFFTDINTGYAASAGLMSKTIDGGLNWSSQTLPHGIASLFFVDANIGYGVAGSYNYPQHRAILKTINGGTDWITILDEQNNALASVFFTSADTGYAAGYNVILKTVDGGLNWVDLPTGTYGCSFNSIYFTDENNGYAVGGNDGGGLIIKTKDAGLTWFGQEIVGVGYLEQLSSVFFPVSDTGYIINGGIFKTVNGGGNPVGIRAQNKTGSHLSIYPNPANDNITITSSSNNGNTQLSIFTVSGEKVIEQQITTSQTQLGISALPQGVYFVRVWDEMGVQVAKMVKE